MVMEANVLTTWPDNAPRLVVDTIEWVREHKQLSGSVSGLCADEIYLEVVEECIFCE